MRKMSLRMFLDSACTNELSSGNGTNPWADRYDGTNGATRQHRIWFKSDDATATYANVNVTATGDTAAIDLQFAPDNAGTPGAFVQSLALANGPYTTAGVFWVKGIVAAGTPRQNFTAADILLTSEEETA